VDIMTEKQPVEPDLNFIAAIMRYGGDSLKKCFQCASCSVACQLSTDQNPFPRKEMIAASWGLKDRLAGNPDIWLCHNCGDCSTLCPRGARPGDTLNAIRHISILTYARPAILGRVWSEPRLGPLLFIVPALVILAVGLATGLLNLKPDDGPIVYAHFFPVALIEMIFIPLSVLVGLVFLAGIRKLFADMQANYLRRGLNDGGPIKPVAFLKTLVTTLPSIVAHTKFGDCGQSGQRKTSHMLVSFSFVNLAMVAGAFVFALYVLNRHGPYSQLNPVKIFANLSGMALIIGSLLLIKDRLQSTGGRSVYFDWYILALALGLGVTGMLTQFIRLADWPTAAVAMYFIHLVLAFNVIACLPFTKMAHFVHRTVALAYIAHVGEKRSGQNV
jgi:quinone-modifying oxidoreductase, subunit QmoC